VSPRILLTISRSWSEWSTVRQALADVIAKYPTAVLVHGDAYHGDRQAAGIWRQLGGVDEPHPAPWSDPCVASCRHPQRRRNGRHYCPVAGLRRNVEMVESGVDLVLSFIRDRSPGASHCTQYAEDAGITVVRYTQEEK
jgi:hypothetical protein